MDESRPLGIPLGRHQLSLLGSWVRSDSQGWQQRPYLISEKGVPKANVALNTGSLRSRYYFLPGQPTYLVDEFVPLRDDAAFQADWIYFTGVRTKTNVESYAAATHSYFWKDRLVLTGGARWDRAATDTATPIAHTAETAKADVRYPGETNLAATWDNMNPQTDIEVTNYSGGVVFRPIKYVAPFYNYSTNSDPGATKRDIYMNLIPYLRGIGQDYGIKFFLFGGRLQGTYTHYSTEQHNVTGTSPGGADSIAAYANTNMQLAEPEYYAWRGAFGHVWGVRWDQVTNGDELEFVFNPTKNLRIRVAASQQETTTGGRYVDVDKFLDEHIPIWTAYANDPATTQANKDTVLNSIPQIRNLLEDFLSINGSPLVGESKYNVSLSASYALDSIRLLRGLRIGANVSYRGPVLVGYQVNQDGSADLSNRDYASGPKYIDLLISYSRPIFRRKYIISVQARISNLLNDHDFVVRKSTWDYTNNKFVNTSNSMCDPRSWEIVARLSW